MKHCHFSENFNHEKTTDATSKQIENLFATVLCLNPHQSKDVTDVGSNKGMIKEMQDEIKTLKEENKSVKVAVDESRR